MCKELYQSLKTLIEDHGEESVLDTLSAELMVEFPVYFHRKPASEKTIKLMENAIVGDFNGKSEKQVVRFSNGEFALLEFPCGDTYLEISEVIENI
jgi:hypothetical protein